MSPPFDHPAAPEMTIEVLVMPGDDLSWRRICENFKAAGFTSLQRFDGIDGRSLAPEALTECLTPRAAYELSVQRRYPFGWVHEGVPSLGAVGCYLGHVELWKRAAARAEPTLVLEQDAELAVSGTQLIKALETMPPGMDVVFLGHLAIYRPRLVEMFVRKPSTGFHPVKPTTDIFCTHAYVITPDGAAKLARNALPINAQVDGYMKFMCTPDSVVRMAYHSPSLIRQRAGIPSSVQPSSTTADHVLQGSMMAMQALSQAGWMLMKRSWWFLCGIVGRKREPM